MYEYLIVGAGITGVTAANILAKEQNKRVLIVEKRRHIGGNCYDYYNEYGLLVHKYGPHIFHTNYKEVWEYLSQFTQWMPYQHKVLAYVDGKLVPIPINLNTINLLFGYSFNSKEMENWIEVNRNNIESPENAEEMVLSRMGKILYKKFFKNYTKKQWGISAQELEPMVTARIPIRFNKDDRYFTDRYQGIPQAGYTKMFENMLADKNIDVLLGVDYKKLEEIIKFNRIIYTGPIDYFFDFQFGRLPYRSLRFEMKTLDIEFYQEAGVINYPNDYDFTRVTEYKHITGQKHKKTTICYEYPQEYKEGNNVPAYPIPKKEYKEIYLRYKKEADKLKSVYFLGRLAEYRYMNMDECVKCALDACKYR